MTSEMPPPPPPSDGSQPAPYPSYSAYAGSGQPEGGAPAEAPAEQPKSIALAVLLMRVGAGLSVVNVIVGLLTRNSLKDNIKDSLRKSGDLTQSNIDTAYNVALSSLAIVGILGVALWLWMAYANGRGRKWARVVATALGGLSTLGFVLSVAQDEATAVSLTLSAVTALLAIVILVLLWRRESSTYYEARSRRS